MKRKVLVAGARGMAGWAVSNYLNDQGWIVAALSRSDFDIARDPFSKFAKLADTADAIVNCAGVIKPQMAKMSPEDVLKVNAVFPRNLAKLGEAKNIPVIHLTTDCVYTGSRGSYSERDYFDATDFYGTSKNSGDITSCMTLRTSIVGEERGQARSLLEWARSQAGKTVNGFTNHFWNGVTTLQFAKIVDRIFSNGLYKKGIFHLHSPDTVTKAQLLKIFSDAYALNLSVQQVEAAEFCDRSLSSQESLSRDLCTLTIAEQVREMREFGLKHP